MSLSQKLETLLFWKAEPVTFEKLASLLDTDIPSIKKGLDELERDLQGRGIAVVQTDEEVMLGTVPHMSPLIETLTKDEFSQDLGKAGLETLSIILYQGPISRTEIDYIRGVNSQFILRTLLVRGLIERVESSHDARIFLYKPTLDLLSHLGITKITDLPHYERVRREIEGFKNTSPQTPQS